MQDTPSASATVSGVKLREQVFLEKTKPPRFDEDCEFPEFQLRWLEWPKTRDHWSNMLSLLARAYEMATHELTLLKVDNQEEKKVVKTKAVAARRLLRILRIRK